MSRARRAHLVHVPNCGHVPAERQGQRQRKIFTCGRRPPCGVYAAKSACEVYPNRRRIQGTFGRWRSKASSHGERSKAPSRVSGRGGRVVRNVSFHDVPSGPSYAGHMDSKCEAILHPCVAAPYALCLFSMCEHGKRQTCRSLPRQAAKNGNIIFHTCCIGTIQYLWNVFHTVENVRF